MFDILFMFLKWFYCYKFCVVSDKSVLFVYLLDYFLGIGAGSWCQRTQSCWCLPLVNHSFTKTHKNCWKSVPKQNPIWRFHRKITQVYLFSSCQCDARIFLQCSLIGLGFHLLIRDCYPTFCMRSLQKCLWEFGPIL